MKYQIMGIQKVDYTNKDNKNVKGTNLHCAYKNKYVEGLSVEKIYISDRIDAPIFSLDDNIDVSYNKYGGVESVTLA